MAPPEELLPLTVAERTLLNGGSTISDRLAARDADFLAEDWTDCEVRAAFLEWFLVTSTDQVTVSGARITGELNLDGQKALGSFQLKNCLFDQALVLRSAQATAIRLSGSHVPALDADALQCDSLIFSGRGVSTGLISLVAAQLGHVSFSGLLLHAPSANALSLDGNVLATTRSADFNRGFEAEGRVRFIGASIGGQLNLRNAIFHAYLVLHEVSTARALYLQQGLFLGNVRLTEAHIGGQLEAADAVFASGETSALRMDGIVVERAVDLSRVLVSGTLAIRGGIVKGSFNLTGASLKGVPAIQSEKDLSQRAVLEAKRLITVEGVAVVGASLAG